MRGSERVVALELTRKGFAFGVLEVSTGRWLGDGGPLWCGPLGFGLLFFFGTVLLAERAPRAERDEQPADRRVGLPGLVGVLVLLVRAFSAPAHPGEVGEIGGLDLAGWGALAVALVAAVSWKRGRASFGTDRLPL